MNPVESPPAGNSAVAWKYYETWVMMICGVTCPPPSVLWLVVGDLDHFPLDQLCSDVVCSCSLLSNNEALPTAVACDVTHAHLSSFPLQTGHGFSLRDIFSRINRHDWTSRGKVKRSSLQLLQWLDDGRLCFPGMCANVKQRDHQQTAKRNTGKGKKKKRKKKEIKAVLPLGCSCCQRRLQKASCFPSADRPDDHSECQDAVKNYGADAWTEQNSRAESRWDPSMYLSAWNDGWLPVGWRSTNSLQLDREKSSPCVCVCVCVFASNSRKLYTYMRSEDDLNICEFLCSPGVVLSQQKNCWLWGAEKEKPEVISRALPGLSALLSGRRYCGGLTTPYLVFLRLCSCIANVLSNTVCQHSRPPRENFICGNNGQTYCVITRPHPVRYLKMFLWQEGDVNGWNSPITAIYCKILL